jgi:hypothetical protein
MAELTPSPDHVVGRESKNLIERRIRAFHDRHQVAGHAIGSGANAIALLLL